MKHCPFCGGQPRNLGLSVRSKWGCCTCHNSWSDAKHAEILEMRHKAEAWDIISRGLLASGAGKIQQIHEDKNGNVIFSVIIDLETAQVTEGDTNED